MATSSLFSCSLLLLLLVAAISSTFAWVPSFPSKAASFADRVQTRLYSGKVEVVSLAEMKDHEVDGTKMATSIVAWLDAEWMPQEVHVQMANSAKKSYITSRESGEDDIMSVMMRVANDLDAKWANYDADSFVGPWDVANYVSDYLTQISGSESCECSTPIH